MHESKLKQSSALHHQRLGGIGLGALLSVMLVTVFVTLGHATAVPVALAPVAKQQFFDSSGRVLSFGCVFTYQSGSTTPLASYTDSTGTVANTNPLILDAGGRAGSTGSSAFFLQAGTAYTIKVVSQGGTNCSLGTTQYTIDGVGGGLTLTTTTSSCTGTCPIVIAGQTQLFQITLTGNTTANPISAVGIVPPATVYFELIQDSGGSHTWTWPSNSIGGCSPIDLVASSTTTQAFVWDGVHAVAIGPCVIGAGPSLLTGPIGAQGNIQTNTQLISTIAVGTAPLVVTSTTQVANLNVSLLEGFNWESPGTIGSVMPNNITASAFRIGAGTTQTATQGTDAHLQTAGTVANSAPLVCTDANGGVTTTCTTTGPVFAPQRAVLGSPVSVSATTQTTILTKSVTFPSATGTYRAIVGYNVWMTTGSNLCAAEVVDHTNNSAFASSGQDSNGTGYIGLAASEPTSQTYAAAAVVSFTVDVQCNNGGGGLTGATVQANGGAVFTMSPQEATYISITPFLSN